MEPKAHESIDSLLDLYNIWSASDDIDAAVDSIATLIEQDPMTMEYMREQARIAGSAESTAVYPDLPLGGAARMGANALGELFGLDWDWTGSYTGQDIQNTMKEDYLLINPPEKGQEALPSPNMLDIYLGYQEPNLPLFSSEDDDVYDLKPYSQFNNFVANPDDMMDFMIKLSKLGRNKTMKIPEGVDPVFGSNIDLGRHTPIVGKNEFGDAYFEVNDVWDFEGPEWYAPLMEALEANPIELKGRWYFDELDPNYRIKGYTY